jgi:hypothetical protein
MDQISALWLTLRRWLPPNRDRWVVILDYLSLWTARVMMASILASIVASAFLADENSQPLGFILSTVLSTILLVYYLGVQTYVIIIVTMYRH